MNKRRWKKLDKREWSDPDISALVLALKLAEEVGEVAGEITDAHVKDRPFAPNLLHELDHVEFILGRLRKRVTG